MCARTVRNRQNLKTKMNQLQMSNMTKRLIKHICSNVALLALDLATNLSHQLTRTHSCSTANPYVVKPNSRCHTSSHSVCVWCIDSIKQQNTHLIYSKILHTNRSIFTFSNDANKRILRKHIDSRRVSHTCSIRLYGWLRAPTLVWWCLIQIVLEYNVNTQTAYLTKRIYVCAMQLGLPWREICRL